MVTIKKNINWIKRKLFRLKSNEKKYMKLNQSTNDNMPSYMFISESDKEKILYSITLMKNILVENNEKIIDKDENELIKVIKLNKNIDKDLLDKYLPVGVDKIELKNLDALIDNLSTDEKKDIINLYHLMEKEETDLNTNLTKIDHVINLIKDNKISIVTKNEIEKWIDNIINDKNISIDTCMKIDDYSKNVSNVIKSADTNFLNNVITKYQIINFITISTVIIDNNSNSFEKLEDDFKNHRYNKFYYEREINRIKHGLKEIKDLKNTKEVTDHINGLQKELYTKSKDKYDLLYNDEIFIYFEKECDDLLNKINAKVIDINKKTNQETKNSKSNKYLNNIMLRFKDSELAREQIFSKIKDIEVEEDITNYINELYLKFDDGINSNFNFTRNKIKTELVILYNGINKVISILKKEPFIMVEHINFKMSDLIEASKVKKEELSKLLIIKNIVTVDETNINKKIELLFKKYSVNNK